MVGRDSGLGAARFLSHILILRPCRTYRRMEHCTLYTFSPVAGTVSPNTTVIVSTSTPGATIYVGKTHPPLAQSDTFAVSAPGTWYAQVRGRR